MSFLDTKRCSNVCSVLVNDCRVEQNRHLESITLHFNVQFSDYSLAFDDSKEVELCSRQIKIFRLITFLNEERGLSYRKISALFNSISIKTHRGKQWHFTGSSAHSVVKRMKQREQRLERQSFSTESVITDFKIT